MKQESAQIEGGPVSTSQAQGGTAVKSRPAPPRVDQLPPWKVLLHSDDVNELGYVIDTIIELAALSPLQAMVQAFEAHKRGVALLLTTHRERAELLCEQFTCKKLTVTMEPDR